MSEIARLASGRWNAILPSLGIPEHYLTNRHQPCPACGGTDRFRYVGGDRGEWFCGGGGQPTGGDGFNLLIHVYGWSFSEAAKAVEDCLCLGSTYTGPRARFRKTDLEYMGYFCLVYNGAVKRGETILEEDRRKYREYRRILRGTNAA